MDAKPPYDPAQDIATELKLPLAVVKAVISLLAEGATVPFIARYRKEATQGADEVAIRAIEELHTYLTELDARRRTVIAEIEKQGKLTPELEKKLLATRSKAELEDLYLPFKPKRRTRAQIARERGLEPLADLIWSQPSSGDPNAAAQAYVDPGKEVADVESALAGARDICAERISEMPEIRAALRDEFMRTGVVRVGKTKAFTDKVTKFDSYADFSEPLRTIPSHRFLAIERGETEEVLKVELETDTTPVMHKIEQKVKPRYNTAFARELHTAAEDAMQRLLVPSARTDTRSAIKQRADTEAVQIFAQNLRELLLSAPLGPKAVLGIDPGQRTGCKCALVDSTGKLLANATIYLVQGDESVKRAKDTLLKLCATHKPVAIAVGNGTHGRETEAFVRDCLASQPGPFCVSVSESGASVYSASEIAREEFPDLDLTVRGAISIARRLQDPLAELVKVEPKSIGVGQYQHDVSQTLLVRKLDEVVESCVNQVGVEVNTASAPLLSRVAGIGPNLAKKIVAHRDSNGSFRSRKQLLKVAGLGPRAYEQCAGFLRITDAEHPLDGSGVHPERYTLVENMAKDLGVKLPELIGRAELVDKIEVSRYQNAEVGAYTLNDILAELKKPGRDPRKSFEPPQFREDVRTLEDLKQGMTLEGVVTNVTAFGAFVDVGVHQDGLVHVSQLSDRFVKNPAEVVKVGDRLKVHVLEVDLQRRRIGLSARSNPGAAPNPGGGGGKPAQPRASGPQSQGRGREPQPDAKKFGNNPFADRFKR
ncbi:MAG TPA: Tex family protein [Polyangiales bacterium]|nr:Tex family protein [Polyangiales bacterium]